MDQFDELQHLFWQTILRSQRIELLTVVFPILPPHATEPKWLSYGLKVARDKGMVDELIKAIREKYHRER